MKTGLVLEGGGLRGLFTAGLTDVLMENGIDFDGLVGVSAGATFGCNYKSRQPGRALRYNMRFRKDPRYMGLRSLITTGDLVGAEFSYHYMPLNLDIFDVETFEKNPMEFHLVCTDVTDGKSVFYKMDRVDYNALEWLRATASMPIVSRPVNVDGKSLLDGGISNSIPLQYFEEQGFERNIVILTQPRGFTKKRTKLMPVFHLTMRRYPAIIHAMSIRHEMYNAQLDYIDRREREGKCLVICPEDVLPIGRTEQNAKKMQNVYNMGRAAGEKYLEKIKAFLAEAKSV